MISTTNCATTRTQTTPLTPQTAYPRITFAMVNVNYLLYESAVGFALFEVVHQADTVGLELPEVKEAMKSLDKFGKMIKLRSFNPWTYVPLRRDRDSPRRC